MEKRCGDLLVVGNSGDDELQKAGLAGARGEGHLLEEEEEAGRGGGPGGRRRGGWPRENTRPSAPARGLGQELGGIEGRSGVLRGGEGGSDWLGTKRKEEGGIRWRHGWTGHLP